MTFFSGGVGVLNDAAVIALAIELMKESGVISFDDDDIDA